MDKYTATEQAFKHGYEKGYADAKKCVLCGEPVEGNCICPKCSKTKMLEYPSVKKKVWCAIKSTFKKQRKDRL